MAKILYTATDCLRCKIVKSFLNERQIAFAERDALAGGKDAFGRFYRANRDRISRGEEGVEFPLWHDEPLLKQGAGVIIAWLQAGEALDGFVSPSQLSHGWIGGLNVSGGQSGLGEDFLVVLRRLKKGGLRTQLETYGRNAGLLAAVIKERLADRLIFNLMGPVELYETIVGHAMDRDEIFRSLALCTQVPEYRIVLTIRPVVRLGHDLCYLTPEEVGEAAAMVEQATGSKRHPFFLRAAGKEVLHGLEPLPAAALFKYRTAARRNLVLAEIER